MLVGKIGKRFVRIDCIAGVERDFGYEAVDDSWFHWKMTVLEVVQRWVESLEGNAEDIVMVGKYFDHCFPEVHKLANARMQPGGNHQPRIAVDSTSFVDEVGSLADHVDVIGNLGTAHADVAVNRLPSLADEGAR